MKEILLTQGKVTIVDDEDYERLNQVKWYASMSGHLCYAKRDIHDNGKRKNIRMHREIMNAPPDEHVDHINGDTLDNRKINLRLCTNHQNRYNQKQPRSDSKLGIKGVSWLWRIKKFRARIRINGKETHLGVFNCMGDADSCYRFAEEKYFGEFARNHKKNISQFV